MRSSLVQQITPSFIGPFLLSPAFSLEAWVEARHLATRGNGYLPVVRGAACLMLEASHDDLPLRGVPPVYRGSAYRNRTIVQIPSTAPWIHVCARLRREPLELPCSE